MQRKPWAIAAFLLSVSALASAQNAGGAAAGGPNRPINGKAPKLVAGTTDIFVLTVGAWDAQPGFTPVTTTAYNFVGGAAYQRFSPSGGEFIAPIHLPAGALIDHIAMDACDTDATLDMGVVIFFHCPTGATGPSGNCDFVDTITPPTGAPGCYRQDGTAALDYTIQDNADHDYFFDFTLPAGGDVGFRGLKIFYRLQVSPAPAVPTFNDVPTDDFGFQYIEALVAAGITGGTGGGNYSPNDPVTRRQMAIFIAKSLGLRWPN